MLPEIRANEGDHVTIKLSALKTSQPVFDIDGGANRYLYQHTVDCDLGDGKITDFLDIVCCIGMRDP